MIRLKFFLGAIWSIGNTASEKGFYIPVDQTFRTGVSKQIGNLWFYMQFVKIVRHDMKIEQPMKIFGYPCSALLDGEQLESLDPILMQFCKIVKTRNVHEKFNGAIGSVKYSQVIEVSLGKFINGCKPKKIGVTFYDHA